ncbi:MAG: endolytic transglycosylase MltG [Ruminococcaceae bacterium]|nr:endolytic transglycosylase MltG [Oscillospiraceae bacterium]
MRKITIKKLIVIVLAVLTVLSLSACNTSNPTITVDEPTTSHTVRLTFPEGSTVAQIAQILSDNGVCSAEEFMAAANDPASLEGFSFEITNPEERAFLLEGYVFPDTYEFYRNESGASALKRFLKNTQVKLDESIYARCDELGYTVDEILTLASIIQEEAGNPAEMGKVSSVIHNRLDSRAFPKLQCDVATFYLRDYVKPYVTEDRYNELVDLYNTYNCEGLPAGPITNVGTDAINAALYPEDTDYYYFITDNEGRYIYAETFSQHKENCRKAGL